MKKLNIPPVFAIISLILIVTFYFILPEFNRIPFPINLSGILVSFAGFVIMGKSRALFKKHKTNLDIVKSSCLVREGVYKKTRNPMYIGQFLFLLGIGVCFKNIFSILIPFVFIILIHFIFVLKEEKLLFEAFGQDYLDYKMRVKRWI